MKKIYSLVFLSLLASTCTALATDPLDGKSFSAKPSPAWSLQSEETTSPFDLSPNITDPRQAPFLSGDMKTALAIKIAADRAKGRPSEEWYDDKVAAGTLPEIQIPRLTDLNLSDAQDLGLVTDLGADAVSAPVYFSEGDDNHDDASAPTVTVYFKESEVPEQTKAKEVLSKLVPASCMALLSEVLNLFYMEDRPDLVSKLNEIGTELNDLMSDDAKEGYLLTQKEELISYPEEPNSDED